MVSVGSCKVLPVILQRAVKVSLQWVGPKDRRRLAALLQAYRAAVNFFVRLLWREPSLGFTTATSKGRSDAFEGDGDGVRLAR